MCVKYSSELDQGSVQMERASDRANGEVNETSVFPIFPWRWETGNSTLSITLFRCT